MYGLKQAAGVLFGLVAGNALAFFLRGRDPVPGIVTAFILVPLLTPLLLALTKARWREVAAEVPWRRGEAWDPDDDLVAWMQESVGGLRKWVVEPEPGRLEIHPSLFPNRDLPRLVVRWSAGRLHVAGPRYAVQRLLLKCREEPRPKRQGRRVRDASDCA